MAEIRFQRTLLAPKVLALISLLTYATIGAGAPPEELSGHTDAVYDIAFSPDGKLMASGSYDRTVKLWELSNRNAVATLQQHNDQVFRVAFSHDGKSLASASGDGTTIIWDIRNRKTRKILAGQDVAVIDVAYADDSQHVATAGSHVRLWDATSGDQIWSMSHPQTFFSIAFSPDQKTLACGTANLIRLVRVSDGDRSSELTVEGGMVYQVDFSPDGRWMASAHANGTLTLWDVGQQTKQRSVKADASALFAAKFSADGRYLVTGGRERVVRVWTVPKLELAREFRGPQETVLAVRYSPDGRLLASGSYAGKIHLWTLATAE